MAIAPLLIRADATTQMGMGHVMRCLALAQTWQDAGGAVTFGATALPESLKARLYAEGMAVHSLTAPAGTTEDAAQTSVLAGQMGAEWVVIDGYQFGAEYQCALKAAGLRVLALDDYGHAAYYYADVVVNQNIYADESLYPHREPSTRLLLGTQYALLRREFWSWRDWQREIPEVARKVLVTLGGGDSNNVTLKVIRALQLMDMPDLEATVVIGGSNPYYGELKAAITSTSWIQLVCNVTNMPELMAWADVAISAAGSTCWELALMGLPSLLIVLAENQRPIATGMAEDQAAVNLGEHFALTATQIAAALTKVLNQAARRHILAQQSRALIDSHGSQRVVDWMQQRLILRPVQALDSELIWNWANDTATRAASFSSEIIPWETHVTWFTERLNDPHCSFYLAHDATGAPLGQIRYQLEGEAATVSVSVVSERRGSGYGVVLIRAGTQRLFADTPAQSIHAYIKPENLASANAFVRAGFTEVESTTIHGMNARHFVYKRKA